MIFSDSPEARSTRQVMVFAEFTRTEPLFCQRHKSRRKNGHGLVRSPKAKKPPNPDAPCDLNANETVLCRTHFHWIILFWPDVFAIPFSLPGVVALIAVPAPSGSTGGTNRRYRGPVHPLGSAAMAIGFAGGSKIFFGIVCGSFPFSYCFSTRRSDSNARARYCL